MGEIVRGLERALLTRPVPTSDAAVRFLLKTEKGSTKNVAVLLGISQRTVQRWVTTRPGMRRRPSDVHAGLIDEAVRARWQPRVRARQRARAETDGFVLHTRARFGFAAPAGSSDDPRVRWITQYSPGEVARELFAARGADAGEQQQTVILARALGHAYLREWGRRAHGLHIASSDVEFSAVVGSAQRSHIALLSQALADTPLHAAISRSSAQWGRRRSTSRTPSPTACGTCTTTPANRMRWCSDSCLDAGGPSGSHRGRGWRRPLRVTSPAEPPR